MTKKRLDQNGFGAVEVLLTLILVVIIIFTGYYVWHSQKNANKNLNGAATVTQSTGTTAKPQYVTIDSWGVRAPYSGTLSLESAVATVNGVSTASFSSTQLDAVSLTCKGGNYGGTVSRYSATQDVVKADGSSTGQTPLQYVRANSGAVYAHVGNYYYLYSAPSSNCGTTSQGRQLQGETTDAVKALVRDLQVVPAKS